MALVAAIYLVAALLLRAPTSVAGQFAALEQGVILGITIFLCLAPTTRPLRDDWTAPALMAVAIVASAHALLRVSVAGASFEETRQLASIFGGSNYVAAVAAAGCITAVILALTASRGRLILGIIAGGLAAVPLLMGSQTSTFTLAVLAIGIIGHSKGSRRYVLVAAPVALLIGVAYGGLLSSRISRGAFQTSWHDRVDLWRAAGTAVFRTPVVGLGPGRLADSLIARGAAAHYVHELPLSILAQYGVAVGLLVLIAMVPREALGLVRPESAALLTLALISLVEPALETMRLGMIGAALAATALWHRAEGPQ